MKILQIIIQDHTALLFTENPEEDIKELKEAYTNDDENSSFGFPLGYETPELTEYTFLGNKYRCISLWFDNEDIPIFFIDFTPPIT